MQHISIFQKWISRWQVWLRHLKCSSGPVGAFFQEANQEIDQDFLVTRSNDPVGGYGNISGQKDDARQLRQPEARILKFIIQHLVNVAGNRAVNKMNSKKLAICWFPSLLPMDFADINRYYEAQPHQEGLVQTMIDQFAFLFLGKNEIVGPNGVEFVTVPEPAANLPNQEKKRSFLNRIFFYSESEFKERIMKKGKTVHVQINNQETTM